MHDKNVCGMQDRGTVVSKSVISGQSILIKVPTSCPIYRGRLVHTPLWPFKEKICCFPASSKVVQWSEFQRGPSPEEQRGFCGSHIWDAGYGSPYVIPKPSLKLPRLDLLTSERKGNLK